MRRQARPSGENLPLTAIQALTQAACLLAQAVAQARGAGFSSLPLPLSHCPTLGELVNEYLLAKERAGRSRGHLHHLEMALGPFRRNRKHRSLASITSPEIEAWLHRKEWAPRTRWGYLLDLRALFNFAVRRGYLTINPANGVDKPRWECPAPGIHTPDQVKQVLATARRQSLPLTRVMAIRYFAGLRTAEACRLVESEIRLGEGFIEIPASKAKTRQRRLVTIQPNLRAWLELGGQLPLGQVNNRFWWLQQAAGVPWPHNVTRHSFCSYHLARFQNAGKTALEAGHSEQMLFAHYRELVTPDQAAAFWGIVPERP